MRYLIPGIIRRAFPKVPARWLTLLSATQLLVFATTLPCRAQSQQAGATPAAKPAAAAPARSDAGAQKPLGMRFAVQIGAYDNRRDANDFALKASQITRAFVLISSVNSGGKELFRVRVLAKSRGEAETIAARFRREGQFHTWVVDLNEQ